MVSYGLVFYELRVAVHLDLCLGSAQLLTPSMSSHYDALACAESLQGIAES